MDVEQLYTACLKMLNDKYELHEYSKDTFISIYNSIYKEHNTTTPTNDINKLILIRIKTDVEKTINNNQQSLATTPPPVPLNLENKLKEIENIRSSMNIISSSIGLQDPINDDINNNNINNSNLINNTIQINNQDPIMINKFKSFIINSNKSNFKINPTIDIKNNIIYPCCLCIPTDIKNKTPYIILSINDNIKNINYTFIPSICNNTWDIWKPITDNYTEINLINNNWNITIIDNFNNLLNLSYFYSLINDVLENNDTFILDIEKPNYFNIGDKIKIIKENGTFIDCNIINKNNNKIIIQKNNLIIENFINAKVFNYIHQLSLIFKYYTK
jgi:hypothetical protein